MEKQKEGKGGEGRGKKGRKGGERDWGRKSIEGEQIWDSEGTVSLEVRNGEEAGK